MRRLLHCLCVLLLLVLAGPAVRACQYCQMAAAGDPEAARLAAQVHGEGFPLEGVINQYAPVAPAATLATPPPAVSVATNASDLAGSLARRATPRPPIASAGVVAPPVTAATTASPHLGSTSNSSHWADAGLLGLVAAGGMFCWRTRRATGLQP